MTDKGVPSNSFASFKDNILNDSLTLAPELVWIIFLFHSLVSMKNVESKSTVLIVNDKDYFQKYIKGALGNFYAIILIHL